MRILLIQPSLPSKERYGKDLGKVGPTCEPMGLAYLAASIKKSKLAEAEIVDMIAMNYDDEDILNLISRKKPDIIGISMLTPMYLKAKQIINLIKEKFNDIIIVVGGAHVTIFPKQTLEENKNIDIAVVGEGEETIVELIKIIKNKRILKNIKGIAYRENDEIILNKNRDFNMNIDSIPFPARELLPMEKYRPAPTYFKRLPSYLVLASRGCPFNCAYCSKISGKIYRKHSIERIIREMELLIEQYKAKEIIFRDDTFTIDREHIMKLCEEIIKRGINKKIKWSCMTRVNLVDEELLKKMKEAGCWDIHYGVESGNQRLLNLINKGVTIEQIKNAFKLTRKTKIQTMAFFMLGLPTETREESLQTIKFSKEIDPDWVQFTITVPYPGTNLYEIAKKDGTLKSFNWEDYQTWAGWSDKKLVYIPKGRNEEELKKLQKYAMRSFYLRPKFILRQIKEINSLERIELYINGAKALVKSGI